MSNLIQISWHRPDHSLEAGPDLNYKTDLVTQEDLLMGSSENVALTELLTRCEMRTLI